MKVLLVLGVLNVIVLSMAQAALKLKGKVTTTPANVPFSNISAVTTYLTTFGYLPTNPLGSAAIVTETDVMEAVRNFQLFAGLTPTGVIDEETEKVMALPRCGVKDFSGPEEKTRKKRYALQGSRWQTKQLTYQISIYPRSWKLSKDLVDEEIKKAFDVWSAVTDLTFTPTTTKPNIDIRFADGEHGDGNPFDGQGGTLAHAYFPVYGGDAHFDNGEQWTINSYLGTNLFQVAAHEFGHSLGLSHSNVHSSLMAPFYRSYKPNFFLDNDDIQAIQLIYGRKTEYRTTTQKPRVTKSGKDSNNDFCQDGQIDAAAGKNGDFYFFRRTNYWKVRNYKIMSGYPKQIAAGWKKHPGNLDAALYLPQTEQIMLLKGSKVWSYKDNKMESGYPKKISDAFPGIPDNVDAAFVWGGNGKLYFFKGKKYWRFDFNSSPNVNPSYPQAISKWNGIPESVDAVLTDINGYTFFFKNDSYWRFNNVNFRVDDASPPYPRSTGKWWFNCQTAEMSNMKQITQDYDDYNEIKKEDLRMWPEAGPQKGAAVKHVAGLWIIAFICIFFIQ